eukprot:1160781-Pelagomonas_calceolata.AAC.4
MQSSSLSAKLCSAHFLRDTAIQTKIRKPLLFQGLAHYVQHGSELRTEEHATNAAKHHVPEQVTQQRSSSTGSEYTACRVMLDKAILARPLKERRRLKGVAS